MSGRRKRGVVRHVRLQSADEQGRRRFMEDYARICRKVEKSDRDRPPVYPASCLEEPFFSRREKAILNTAEKAQQDFGSLGLSSVFETFAETELCSWRSCNELDVDGDLGIAASIWMLGAIQKAGSMVKLEQYLSDDIGPSDYILPLDFAHPSFSAALIESMYHELAYRFEEGETDLQESERILTPENTQGKRTTKKWQQILDLIPKEEIEKAEKMFRDTQWEIESRMMRAAAYYDQKIRQYCEDYNLPLDKDGRMDDESAAAFLASLKQNGTAKIPDAVGKKILDAVYDSERLALFSDTYFLRGREYTLKDTGSQKIADLMSDVRVEDPYAVSFAIFSLLDEGDDAPWLMHSANILLQQTLVMLPWYRDDEYWDDEKTEAWYEPMPFNKGDWLHNASDPKNTDFYHTRCGSMTLAQIIYEYSRVVVPMGPRPFDDKVQELVQQGLDEKTAREVTNTAGLLYLPRYQAKMDWEMPDTDFEDDDLFSDEAGDGTDEELFPTSGYWADVAKSEGVEPPEQSDSDEDLMAELAKDMKELVELCSSQKRENDSLLAQLSGEKKKAKEFEENTKAELESLRREHQELADLRELIFRQENQQEKEEVPDGAKVAFPYETKKRTVLFGGFETFRKSLRQLLPGVKFVGVDQMNFDSDLVRNADVVWFQTNCLSHSQYYAVQRLARAAGVQMRYFTYQGALPCAEQLALADAEDE